MLTEFHGNEGVEQQQEPFLACLIKSHILLSSNKRQKGISLSALSLLLSPIRIAPRTARASRGPRASMSGGIAAIVPSRTFPGKGVGQIGPRVMERHRLITLEQKGVITSKQITQQ
jgi:hypothetical protein